MRRSNLLVLAILVLSGAVAYAQGAVSASQGGGSHGGGSHGGGSHGVGGRTPGHGARPGHSNGFFPLRSGDRHNRGSGALWLPYGVPYWDDDGNYWDEPSYQQPSQPPASPQVIMVENKQPEPPPPPPQPPKLIEVAQSKEAPIGKPQPAALFVLKNGQQLESRNYSLTAQSLQIEIGRQRREIPVDTLDLDATIAANHQRGIEVTIPRDRTAMFVSF